MDVELIVFDCDGVLVDSERLSAEVLREMAAELGIAFTSGAALEHLRGRKVAEWVAELAGLRRGGVPADFTDEFRRRTAEAFDAHLVPVPGVREVLDAVDVPYCVASSAPLHKIHHTLGLTGLLTHFGDRVHSAYEVGSWKPEPDLFLHAARDAGVDPAHCVVVEDSVPGVRAGVAAGMTVLGYAPPGSGMGPVLAERGAHPFPAMSELPRLLDRLRSSGGLADAVAHPSAAS